MAIIKSCCFWKSLRKGCYASAIYALVSVNYHRGILKWSNNLLFSKVLFHGIMCDNIQLHLRRAGLFDGKK